MNYKFTHTCIRVLDLEKSIEFYEKALNLKVTRRKDNPEYKFTLVYLSDEDGVYELELTYNYDTVTPYELGTGYSHVAFLVEDIEKSHEFHKSLGLEVTDLKSPTGNGFVYFITDPDGYKVELIG